MKFSDYVVGYTYSFLLVFFVHCDAVGTQCVSDYKFVTITRLTIFFHYQWFINLCEEWFIIYIHFISTHREKVKIKNMLHFLKIRFFGLHAASLNNKKIIASLILKIYLVEIFENFWKIKLQFISIYWKMDHFNNYVINHYDF